MRKFKNKYVMFPCSSVLVSAITFGVIYNNSLYLFFTGIMYAVLMVTTLVSVWKNRVKNVICYTALYLFSFFYIAALFSSGGNGTVITDMLTVVLQLAIIVLTVKFAVACRSVEKTIEKEPITKGEKALSFAVLAQVVLSVVQCVLRSVLNGDLLFGNYKVTKVFDLQSANPDGAAILSLMYFLYLLPYLLILVFCAVSIYRGKTETVGLGACAYALEIAAICISLYADLFGVNAAAGFAFRWELIPHLLSDAAVFAFLIRYLIKKRRERKAALQAELLPEQQA